MITVTKRASMALSNSIINSKQSGLGKARNTAPITEMTFMTGQEYNQESTNTDRIYSRIVNERNEEREKQRLIIQKRMLNLENSVSQRFN